MKDMFDPEKWWVCSRRGCGWRGPFKDELRIPHEGGHLLVCPRCWCEAFYEEKPLFIPLKREHFEAFKAGTKPEEYRPYGKIWNEVTCHIGREVILSLGYSKEYRLTGTITSFRKDHAPGLNIPAWNGIYGTPKPAKPGKKPKPLPTIAACIGIKTESGVAK